MGLGPGILPPTSPRGRAVPPSLASRPLRPKARDGRPVPSRPISPSPERHKQPTSGTKQGLTQVGLGSTEAAELPPKGRWGPRLGPVQGPLPRPPGTALSATSSFHRSGRPGCRAERWVGILAPTLPCSPHDLDQVTSLAGSSLSSAQCCPPSILFLPALDRPLFYWAPSPRGIEGGQPREAPSARQGP